MATIIAGKKIVFMYRLLDEAATEDGWGVAFQTENSESISNDADTTQTKNGPIATSSGAEVEISATAVAAVEEVDKLDKLKNACRSGATVEVWKADLDIAGTGADADKYKGTYYQAKVTSYELTANAEDHAEASVDFACIGTGADGYVTVPDSVIEAATYTFTDTPKTGS